MLHSIDSLISEVASGLDEAARRRVKKVMRPWHAQRRHVRKPKHSVFDRVRESDEKAVNLAKFFHDTYERLAPKFGYKTREDTKKFDPNSPNGKLMSAVAFKVMTTFGLGKTPVSEANADGIGKPSVRGMKGKMLARINARGLAGGWHAERLASRAKAAGKTMADVWHADAPEGRVAFNVPAKATHIKNRHVHYQFADGSTTAARLPESVSEVTYPDHNDPKRSYATTSHGQDIGWRPSKRLKVGDKVEICHGSGCDSGKRGTITSLGSKEHSIKFADGTSTTMFHNRLRRVAEARERNSDHITLPMKHVVAAMPKEQVLAHIKKHAAKGAHFRSTGRIVSAQSHERYVDMLMRHAEKSGFGDEAQDHEHEGLEPGDYQTGHKNESINEEPLTPTQKIDQHLRQSSLLHPQHRLAYLMKVDNWVPANGGHEQPFKARSGKVMQYMYHPKSGKHAYYDVHNDLIMSDEEAEQHMNPDWRRPKAVGESNIAAIDFAPVSSQMPKSSVLKLITAHTQRMLHARHAGKAEVANQHEAYVKQLMNHALNNKYFEHARMAKERGHSQWALSPTNEARKITNHVVDAFLAKKYAKRDNSMSMGGGLYLHKNLIARHKPEGGIEFSMAGWPTRTTADRLNGVLHKVNGGHIHFIKGQPHHTVTKDGKQISTKISSKEWYSVPHRVSEARTRLYLGLRAGNKDEVFRSASEPTRETHGHLYNAVMGPFRTKAAAEFTRDHGRGNPHITHVRDAERIVKARKAKAAGGVKESATVPLLEGKLTSAGYRCVGFHRRTPSKGSLGGRYEVRQHSGPGWDPVYGMASTTIHGELEGALGKHQSLMKDHPEATIVDRGSPRWQKIYMHKSQLTKSSGEKNPVKESVDPKAQVVAIAKKYRNGGRGDVWWNESTKSVFYSPGDWYEGSKVRACMDEMKSVPGVSKVSGDAEAVPSGDGWEKLKEQKEQSSDDKITHRKYQGSWTDAPAPDDYTKCPTCGSVNDNDSLLGQLGQRHHYRCRGCGMNYSHEAGRNEATSLQDRAKLFLNEINAPQHLVNLRAKYGHGFFARGGQKAYVNRDSASNDPDYNTPNFKPTKHLYSPAKAKQIDRVDKRLGLKSMSKTDKRILGIMADIKFTRAQARSARERGLGEASINELSKPTEGHDEKIFKVAAISKPHHGLGGQQNHVLIAQDGHALDAIGPRHGSVPKLLQIGDLVSLKVKRNGSGVTTDSWNKMYRHHGIEQVHNSEHGHAPKSVVQQVWHTSHQDKHRGKNA